MPLPAPATISQYFYGNSLVNFASGQPDTNVPYWMNLLLAEAGLGYEANGGYGFLRQFAGRDTPANEWGFAGVRGAWDSDTTDFAQVAFDQIMITPANFIQDAPASQNYEGDVLSPLAATIDIIADTLQDQPQSHIFIYEGWADLGAFSAQFPPAQAALAQYYAFNQAGYHSWYLDYTEALRAAFPAAEISLIPVAPVLAGLLGAGGPLEALDVNDLFVDSAPHGTSTLYFLASLITYTATRAEPAPESFVPPATLHPLVAQDYGAVLAFITAQTAAYLAPTDTPPPEDADLTVLLGTEGDDHLTVTETGVRAEGLGGDDRLTGHSAEDRLDGGAGHDVLRGLRGADTLLGADGNDRLMGGGGRDMLVGGQNNDVLRGGKGHDTLYGQSGRDKLKGGGGNDLLDGGAGRDTLKGGAGADVFVFATGHGHDRVVDFEDGHDRIDVQGLSEALIQSIAAPSFREIIAPGESYTQSNGTDSWELINRSETAILLTHDDFIFSLA